MKIELFTHDKNEITALDYALATFIDSIEMDNYSEKYNITNFKKNPLHVEIASKKIVKK